MNNKKKITTSLFSILLFFHLICLSSAANADASSGFPFFVKSLKDHMVDFVYHSVSTLKYTAYKLGGWHIDSNRGIYIVDCSGYVDYSLQTVCPKAYSSLVNSAGCYKPNSLHYYDFFQKLSYDSKKYWNKVDDIGDLQPGDILVFRYKNSHRPGHVMIVMGKPVKYGDVYMVSIADSARSGHSQDTRQGHSGIGIGSLLLKANHFTGAPQAYAWRIGSYWVRNVNFAMARPLDDGGSFKSAASTEINSENNEPYYSNAERGWRFTPSFAGSQGINSSLKSMA